MSTMPIDQITIGAPGLNWVRTGPRNGWTVVLLHSAGLDLTYWDRQIEALSADHDIVAVDLRGHGRSAAPPPGWTFEREAAEVADLIGHLGSTPAHVVGVSYGGMVAQSLVLGHPHRVGSLSLISTAATFAEPARSALRGRGDAILKGGMAATLAGLDRWLTPETMLRRPDLVDRMTKTLLGGDPDVHAALWTRVAQFDVLDWLAAVRCPTLALVCERDVSTPPPALAAVVARIAGARLVTLPGGAHLAHLESPAATNAELHGFLSSVSSQ